MVREALRKCAFLLRHERRSRWLLVLALAIVASALEAAGASLVYVLVGMVTAPGEPLELPVVGDPRDLLGLGAGATGTVVVGVMMAVFFVVRGAFIMGQTYAVARLQEHAAARLASRLARGYMGLPYEYQARRNMADLVRNVTGATGAIVAYVLSPAFRALSEGLVILALAGVLIVAAPAASLVVLLVMAGLALMLMKVLQPRLRRLGEITHETGESTLLSLHHSFQGLRDIRLMGRESFFHAAFERARMRAATAAYTGAAVREIPRVVLETGVVLLLVAVLVVTVAVQGQALAALPVLGVFAYAALRLKPAVNTIIDASNSLRYASAPIDKLYDDLREIELLASADAVGPSSDVVPVPFEHEIELRDVYFRYTPDSPDVLTGVDLTIEKGRFVGIIGPTGGGKSTLLDLIVGLVQPTRGSVLVDGIDVATDPEAWQRNIAMVSQDVFLVDDTLRRNVAFGFADEEIDAARVSDAVRIAQLQALVDELPDGLDTLVGERGARLSGGQRQRVAIARALYRRAPVLVLDEGTSALDVGTEDDLLRALCDVRRDHTIIMVAHRVASLRGADRVFLIRNGRIDGEGKLDDLIAQDPVLGRSPLSQP